MDWWTGWMRVPQCCVMAAPQWAERLPEIIRELLSRPGSVCLSENRSFMNSFTELWLKYDNTMTPLLLDNVWVLSSDALPAQLVDTDLALSLDGIQAATHGALWLRGSSVRLSTTVKRCSKLLSERTFWNVWNHHERSSDLLSRDVFQTSMPSPKHCGLNVKDMVAFPLGINSSLLCPFLVPAKLQLCGCVNQIFFFFFYQFPK